jgi:hypothetical protein
VLVRWSELPEELATWEDLEALKSNFPAAPAWGQAAIQARGNVRELVSELLLPDGL